MIASTLVDTLRHRADHLGDQLAYAYLEHGAVETEHLTYGSLDQRARAIAARIQSICTPGDRALLLYPAGLEFLAGLLGCLYAAIIAIPAPPGTAAGSNAPVPACGIRSPTTLGRRWCSPPRRSGPSSRPPILRSSSGAGGPLGRDRSGRRRSWGRVAEAEDRADRSLLISNTRPAQASTPRGGHDLPSATWAFQLANLQRLCGYGPGTPSR